MQCYDSIHINVYTIITLHSDPVNADVECCEYSQAIQ